MRIGSIIRKWRIVSERSLRSLAEEVGISHSTLARLEKGENIDGRSLVKVLTWLFAELPAAGDQIALS